MKRVLLVAPLFLAMLFLAAPRAAQAAAKSWNGSVSTDWNDGNNWTPAGVPAAGDDVTLPSGALPNQPSITSVAVTIHNLTSGAGRILTIGTGRILTIDGSATTATINVVNGTVTASGTGLLRTQGSVSIVPFGSSGFQAPLEVNTGTTTSDQGNFGGAVTVAAGATLQVTNNQTFIANNNVTINGTLSGAGTSSTFRINGATFTNNGSVTIATTQFGASGTQSLAGTGTWTGTNLTVLNGSTTTLANDVTIATTNFTVNLGAMINPGGFVLTLNGVSFLNNGGTLTGTGTLRTQGATSISGNSGTFSSPLEVNSGTTTINQLNYSETVTVATGATLQVSNNQSFIANNDVTINGTLSGLGTGSVFRFNGAILTNNGSVTVANFNFGGTVQTLTGAGSVTSNTVSVLSGSTTTLGSAQVFGNGISAISLVINGGTLSLGSFVLTLNGVSVTNGGTVTGTGTFRTQGTTTITPSGAPTFSAPLEINSGTTTINGGTFSSSISILSGATLLVSGVNTIVASGDVNINSGGALSGISSAFNAGGANIVNNGSVTLTFRFNRSGAQVLSGTGSFSSNPVSILSGSTTTLGSKQQMSTLVINAGGALDISNRTLSLSGAGTPLTNNGTLTTTGSTIAYNGTVAQTVAAANVNYNSLTIDNVAGGTLTAAKTIPGTLTLANGTFNNGANLTLASGATIARSGGTLQTAPTLLGTLNVEYFGSSPINTGVELPSSTTTLNNLTMNNLAGVTLSNSPTVSGTLFLNGATLMTGANTLTVAAAGSVTRASGFVAGNLRRIYSAPGTKTFDVGTGTSYLPAQITALSLVVSPADVTVTANCATLPGLPANQALSRSWSFSNNGVGNATVAFSYNDMDAGAANESLFRIAKKTPFDQRFLFPNGSADNVNEALNQATLNSPLILNAGASSWTLAQTDAPGAKIGEPRRVESFDFDGDAKTDVAYWRPTTGEWRIINSANGTTRIHDDWGRSSLGDVAVPGDYDGDTKTDLAVFRPSEGNWYVVKSSDGTPTAINWGQQGDRVVPGDYDGDGKTDTAVFRPTENNWYVKRSSGGNTVQGWGLSGDQVVPCDYDGDGKTDLAVFRPVEGNWYILKSGGGTTITNWGGSSDVPVPGDYDGDGKADVAIFRPAEGNWYIRRSSDNSIRVQNWGNATDKLIPADYDRDGKTDFAVFRPSEGNWYILRSSDGATLQLLGTSGDVPVPSAAILQ